MKFKNLFIVSAIAVLLTGCSTPAIYSPKALDEFITDLQKISKDYTVETVTVRENEKLMNDFGSVTVQMRNSEGREFTQSFYYNSLAKSEANPKPASEYDVEDDWKSRKLPSALNIDDIVKQKGNIGKYVEEGIRQITEGFDGQYDFRSAQSLEFSADAAGALQIQFTLNATPRGQSAQFDGRKVTTNYYELNFVVDKDGNVVFSK